MTRRCTSVLLGLAMALVVSGTAVGATIALTSKDLTVWRSSVTICAGGTQTLISTKDTYVQQDSPTANNATASDLFVQSKAGNQNRRALVQFTLPSVPAGCSVTSATLRMYSTAWSPTTRTIQVFRLGATWAESVGWSAQPATSGTAVTATSRTSAGFKDWNVAQMVRDMYAGTNNGFQVRDQTENSSSVAEQKYTSKEYGTAANRPQLVVTFG